MFWATIGALLFDSAYDLCATAVCAASDRERERDSERTSEREREVARAVRTSGGISDLSFCSAQRVLNATACVHSEIAETKARGGGWEVEEGRKREVEEKL